MLIIGPDSAFQLRLVQVNPREFTGVGTEVPRSSKEIERITESPEFGLRAITDADIQEIVQSLTSQIDVRPKLQSIIQRNPLVHDEIRDTGADLFLSGPVLTTPDFKSLSVETLKLQKSLERDAMETFRRKYPHRAGMFT